MTPGNHDGVHLGHRALLRAAREVADPAGFAVVALTFDPHPAQILAPQYAPPLLTTPRRRVELLRAFGADDVVVQPFTAEFATKTPEAFAREVLVDRLAAKCIVVGPDFRFGKGRSGDVARLREIGSEHGFGVRIVEPECDGRQVISSTRVRTALKEGDVLTAAQLLGRVHDVEGTVVRGHARGRSIGTPTANLDCDPVLMPADGVYAVVARVLGEDRERIRGVANLGVRPTFAAGRSVEVHLLDFEGDLYDQRLRIGFVTRLRGERRFDGIDALKAQIQSDIASAKEALERAAHEAWQWI